MSATTVTAATPPRPSGPGGSWPARLRRSIAVPRSTAWVWGTERAGRSGAPDPSPAMVGWRAEAALKPTVRGAVAEEGDRLLVAQARRRRRRVLERVVTELVRRGRRRPATADGCSRPGGPRRCRPPWPRRRPAGGPASSAAMANSCQRLARSLVRASSSNTWADRRRGDRAGGRVGQLDLDRADQLDPQLGEPVAHRCGDRRGLVEQLAGFCRIALDQHQRQHAQRRRVRRRLAVGPAHLDGLAGLASRSPPLL